MPPARLDDLNEDLLRLIVANTPDFEQRTLALLCKKTCTLVREHRHGAVLPLRSRRPPQRDFLHAFGMTLSEISPHYTAPRDGSAKVYDLATCLPLALQIKGGWQGVKAAQEKQRETASRKRKREEMAAVERAARRRRVDVALRRAGVATGLEEFEQDVGDVRRSMPVSFEQYLQGRVPFEDGFFDLVELAQRIHREYEVCSWFSVLPCPSSLAHERAREYIFNGGRADRTLVDVLGDALELRRTSPWGATLVSD